MQEINKYTVFNIREYLNTENPELGESELFHVLSGFSCSMNPDVERFVKKQSVEFAKKQQSVTYLVFSTEDAELLGYFAITIKPITVNAEPFSNTTKRKLARVSELNGQNGTYNLALLSFYHDNGFQQFDSRLTESADREPHELIQFLKILK